MRSNCIDQKRGSPKDTILDRLGTRFLWPQQVCKTTNLEASDIMTHGISSGSTSASMLIDSVLALHVGAAASSSLSRDIMYCGKFGSMALYNASAAVSGMSVSGYKNNVTSCQLNVFQKDELIGRFRFPRWRRLWPRDITRFSVVWCHAYWLKFWPL